MQSLMLADDLFDGLLDGSKTVTVRTGHRDLHPGALMFEPVNGMREPVRVQATSVVHKLAREITDEEARGDGAECRADLIEAMKRFYPEITEESPVTVIAFSSYDEHCRACGRSLIPGRFMACDKTDGYWCPDCFADTPCGREEHGEGCPTIVYDDGTC